MIACFCASVDCIRLEGFVIKKTIHYCVVNLVITRNRTGIKVIQVMKLSFKNVLTSQSSVAVTTILGSSDTTVFVKILKRLSLSLSLSLSAYLCIHFY